jgi:hypothetical protein
MKEGDQSVMPSAP